MIKANEKLRQEVQLILEPNRKPEKFYISTEEFKKVSEGVKDGKSVLIHFYKDKDDAESALDALATPEMCAEIELGNQVELPKGALLKGEGFGVKLKGERGRGK